MRARRTELADDDGPPADSDGDARFSDQPEADLAPTRQLDINLGEKLCVEQRSVLDPMAAVDAEAHAQGVEAVLGARMPASRECQRVDHSAGAHRHAPATRQFGIQEAEVERRYAR